MARIQSTHRYWFLLALLLLGFSSYAQNTIVYVNAAANGANNGSSWADAYTNLHSALLNPTAEIWVAAGTYLPHPSDPDVSYAIQGKQALYGGFAGGEIMRSERDPNTNPTILSGDLGQDDLTVPTAQASDIQGVNSENVITYWAEQGDTITIDGFMIVGGDTPPNGGNFGGGVRLRLSVNNQLGEIKVSFNDCTFQANRSSQGGAIAVANLAGGSQDVQITNCLFRGNEAIINSAGRGGAIQFVGRGSTLMKNQVKNCQFIRNACGSFGGAIDMDLMFSTNNTVVEDCSFEDNQAPFVWVVGGGGINIRNTRGDLNAQINRCQFINNGISTSGFGPPSVELGGAISLRQNDLSDSSSLQIFQCHFSGNQATEGAYGSAIALSTTSVFTLPANTFPFSLIVDSSTFVGNGLMAGAAADGGAISVQTTDSKVNIQIRNSVIEKNRANNGGGIFIEDIDQANTSLLLENCQLLDNLSQNLGGAISLSGTANQSPYTLKTEIYHSRFEDNIALSGGAVGLDLNGLTQAQADLRFEDNYFGHNRANFIGGAISSVLENPQNVSFNHVRDTFEYNQALTEGGAIHTDDSGFGNIVWKMDQSLLSDNKASFGGGANFSSSGGTLYQMEMIHTQMWRDSAATGAALYLDGLKGFASFDHLLFAKNQSTNTAAALQVQTPQNLAIRVFSSTLTQNRANANTDLFQLQTQNNGSITFDVFNSIFWDNGSGTDIVGQGNVTSTYANSLFETPLPGDNNLSIDPLFLDPSNGDFQLDWASPAVDVGNPSFLNPATDLNGNPRQQGNGLDLGVYESPFTTSLETPTQAQLKLFPNPSSGLIQLELPTNSKGESVVSLYDPLGALVFRDRFAERSSPVALDFSSLPAGIYLLSAEVEGQTFRESVIIH